MHGRTPLPAVPQQRPRLRVPGDGRQDLRSARGLGRAGGPVCAAGDMSRARRPGCDTAARPDGSRQRRQQQQQPEGPRSFARPCPRGFVLPSRRRMYSERRKRTSLLSRSHLRRRISRPSQGLHGRCFYVGFDGRLPYRYHNVTRLAWSLPGTRHITTPIATASGWSTIE